MGSPRERGLQGVWASRVTGVVDDGSSGDEGVLDAGSGCAYDEENGIVELFTEESVQDDPRSSPSVRHDLFFLITFLCKRFLDLLTVTIFHTRVCSTSAAKGVQARRARIANDVRRQELRLKRRRYTCVLHALCVGFLCAAITGYMSHVHMSCASRALGFKLAVLFRPAYMCW